MLLHVARSPREGRRSPDGNTMRSELTAIVSTPAAVAPAPARRQPGTLDAGVTGTALPYEGDAAVANPQAASPTRPVDRVRLPGDCRQAAEPEAAAPGLSTWAK